jgi:cell division transport system permease protein
MAMKIKMIGYAVSEGLKNVWRNRAMSVASITSVAATLVILGIVFILIANINLMAQGAKDQFTSLPVYLKDSVSTSKAEEIGREILLLDGVKDIKYVTKDEALENYKKQWGKNASLLEGMEENPLPNSYVVSLKDLVGANSVADKIKAIDGVEQVKSYRDVVDKILNITMLVRNVGISVIVALIAVSTMIISNTIKLAVFARRREISIMKYVGATSWFVRWPFLLEGTILGFIGSVIALAIIFLGYNYVASIFNSEFYVLVAAYIIDVKVMVSNLMLLFIVIGAGIGALGSLMSLRKHLEV